MEYSRKSAEFSPCRKYRYTLWRVWDDSKPYCQFIGLNPSTADEVQDDPTVRRCIQYAKDWGYGALVMTNLLPFRATLPADMHAHYSLGCNQKPNMTTNIQQIYSAARNAGIVVAAWGSHGDKFKETIDVLLSALQIRDDIKIFHLGLTKSLQPKHPLYLRKDERPRPYTSNILTE